MACGCQDLPALAASCAGGGLNLIWSSLAGSIFYKTNLLQPYNILDKLLFYLVVNFDSLTFDNIVFYDKS